MEERREGGNWLFCVLETGYKSGIPIADRASSYMNAAPIHFALGLDDVKMQEVAMKRLQPDETEPIVAAPESVNVRCLSTSS